MLTATISLKHPGGPADHPCHRPPAPMTQQPQQSHLMRCIRCMASGLSATPRRRVLERALVKTGQRYSSTAFAPQRHQCQCQRRVSDGADNCDAMPSRDDHKGPDGRNPSPGGIASTQTVQRTVRLLDYRRRSDSNRRITDLQSVALIHLATPPTFLLSITYVHHRLAGECTLGRIL